MISESLPIYRCFKIAQDHDNLLDIDWDAALAAGPFILADVIGAAIFQTRVRAVWSDEALYIAFDSDDPEPWATLTERDQSLYEEEVVEVFLAPTSDLTRYFEIEINPLGTLFDARIEWFGMGKIMVHRDWNCSGLIGSVSMEPGRGWTAFLKIPFAGLAVSPKPGDTWRINFFRIERRPKKEFSSWSPLSTDAPEFHSPNRFGVLEFTESK